MEDFLSPKKVIEKKETADEKEERLEREFKKYISEKKSKAERFASEFSKYRRKSLEEKEKKTIQKLAQSVKEDPEILSEIQSYRKRLLGLGQPKVQKSISPLKKTDIAPVKSVSLRSDDAQKVFYILAPVLKKFMNEYQFPNSVKFSLYKYFILFLLNDPEQLIKEVGTIFDDNLQQDIKSFLEQIETQVSVLEKEVEKHVRNYKLARETSGPIGVSNENQLANQKRNEIKYLKSIWRMFILSDLRTIRDYIIQEIGKNNFEQFVYLISSYFYEPETGSEYLRTKAKWSEERKGKAEK